MPDPANRPLAALLTLGCKLNTADSEAIARRLNEAGWNVVERASAEVDAVVVNTCSVTHVADHKSRQLTRRARRLAPQATVAVTGCLVETATRQSIEGLGAGLVYRQPDQGALAEKLIELRPTPATARTAPAPGLRTRAFISAHEGCNDVCAFCIVPRTRGRERSKPVAAVVAEARAREAEGAREIVITGTQLGAYGRDRGRRSIEPLLVGLLEGTAAARIRMSSLQPQDLTAAIVALWRDGRLCRHFHLALQSGSEAVLRRMRRRYSVDEYRRAVELLRREMPDVAITTDLIVGFPGESEAEFEESFAFCREMAFAGVHVFPYSQRSGTAAAKMADSVGDGAKRDRVRRVIALADEMATAYRSRFVGTTAAVLWERRRGAVWEGLTDTYVRVQAASEADLHNQITAARLVASRASGLEAEVEPL